MGPAYLHAPALMMDIVIIRVVVRDPLQWVPRKSETRMIVNGLEGAHGEEEDALADAHTGQFESEQGADCIFEEAFEGVVVERSKCIRDVEAMVARVKGTVEPLMFVHLAVDHVLPSVNEEGRESVLEERDDDPIEYFGELYTGSGRQCPG